MSSFVDEVRRGLEELRVRDKALKIFGAKSHRYRLNPVLTEAKLRKFERQWRFRVPAEYRTFLLELGDGGAGPYYGIFRLGEIDDGFEFTKWKTWKLEPHRKFPHLQAWNDRELLFRSAPDREDEAAYERWLDSDAREADLQAYVKGLAVDRGCIPLCHEGCAYRDWLVVTGPEAGHVWHDASPDEAGVRPVQIGKRKRVSFSAWYLDWLRRALAERGAASEKP
jgi:hypothetical protein